MLTPKRYGQRIVGQLGAALIAVVILGLLVAFGVLPCPTAPARPTPPEPGATSPAQP